MFGYITSMLGFGRNTTAISESSSRNIDQNNNSNSNSINDFPPASCRGWPRPDPAVRLRLSDETAVRIFGFPADEDLPSGMRVSLPNIGNGGTPFLYLRGRVPAYVSYIMGDDWRSRLTSDHQTSEMHIFHDGEVILRTPATDREGLDVQERIHCLRMRRCGASAVRSEVDIVTAETTEQDPPSQLFGWPVSGGVWVLRLPQQSSVRTGSNEAEVRVQEEMWERFALAEQDIMQQEDMQGVCRVLENAGARFYERLEDCPEVLALELLE